MRCVGEGPLQGARRACSIGKKSMFSNVERHGLEAWKACVGNKGCERCLQVWAGLVAVWYWRNGKMGQGWGQVKIGLVGYQAFISCSTTCRLYNTALFRWYFSPMLPLRRDRLWWACSPICRLWQAALCQRQRPWGCRSSAVGLR